MVRNLLLVCLLLAVTVIRVLQYQPLSLHDGEKVRVVDYVENLRSFENRSDFRVHGYYVRSIHTPVQMGDRVQVIGTVREEHGFISIEADEVLVLYQEGPLFGFVRSTRAQITDMVDRWLPHTEASVAKGIVWGEQKDLSKEVKQNFQAAGLSHLLVASGFNVTLLAISLEFFSARWFGKKQQIYFVIFCTIIYGFILRYSIPVLRAIVLLVVVYVSRLQGRRTSGGYVLLLAGLVLILLQPNLATSVSFQLSFLATAGLIYAQNTHYAVINLFVKPSFVIVFTLPILLFNFGSINLLSIPANVLVEPFIPLLSEILIIAEIIGVIIDQLGMLMAWTTLPLLHFLLRVAEFVARQEWAIVRVGDVSAIGWSFYYLVLLGYLYFRDRRSLKRYVA